MTYNYTDMDEEECLEKYCRLCGSKEHWAYDCPDRKKGGVNESIEEYRRKRNGGFWRNSDLH